MKALESYGIIVVDNPSIIGKTVAETLSKGDYRRVPTCH
jgi:hypothetical protein